MSLDLKAQMEALKRLADEKQAEAEKKRKGKKRKKTVEAVPSSLPQDPPPHVSPGAPGGSSSRRAAASHAFPAVHGDQPDLSYSEMGTLFVPQWTLKTEESVSTDMVSAMKFWEGCVPPLDRDSIHVYPDEELDGLFARSAASVMFFGREEAERRRLKDAQIARALGELDSRDEALRVQKEDFEKQEAAMRLEIDGWSKKYDDRVAAQEREVEELTKKFEAAQLERDFGTYGMAWNELRGKAEAQFNISLADIRPEVAFEVAAPSPSRTLADEEGDDGDDGDDGDGATDQS